MGSGEKNHHHHNVFQIHFHGGNSRKDDLKDIPRGCLAIMVGQGDEQQRFIVPVDYFNHPRFRQLLKEAEEEYGFHHDGLINIPCHVEEFRQVQGLIDKETSHHHHHNHHQTNKCFRIRA